MKASDTKRISRLTAILTILQTKRLVTATSLAEKFDVSVRTIYRDIKALEQAGVPVFTEEGKGYTLMPGYRIPPVMFTENEANALIMAEQLVQKNKDASLVKEYTAAIDKIKAVLRVEVKDKANLLSDRTSHKLNQNTERTSNNLTTLQFAITNYCLSKISYTNEGGNATERVIEPFALLSTENWILLAYCHLREEFRFFRLDRISKLEVSSNRFAPHDMTLQEYFEKYHQNR